VAASKVSREKFWRLPIQESYWQSMSSRVADMLNTGPLYPKAGVITGALFLKQLYSFFIVIDFSYLCLTVCLIKFYNNLFYY
jgi:leucyl aminopeptidase